MKARAYYGWWATAIVLLLGFAVVISAFSSNTGPKVSDAFLDQPIPPGFVPHLPEENMNQGPKPNYGQDYIAYQSYQERLDALKQLSPRRLILPEGFADFIAKGEQRSDWKKGDELFSNERNGCAGGGITYRAFMTQSFLTLGLSFKYDSGSDALVADFPWHREDSRSNQELLQVLKTTQPIAMGIPDPNLGVDPWRTAFDALLSKSGNFSSAWKLRYLDDVRGRTFSFIDNSGTILWAGELPDEKAKKHFVAINYHPGELPEGMFCCYVFDSGGQFEYGATLDGAYRCGDIPHVDLQPSGKGLTVYYSDGNRRATGYLYLEREGVMLHDSDARNSSYLGIPLYRTETMLN